MNHKDLTVARQIEEAAIAYQKKTTGYEPKAVTVVLSEDTLVVTLHDAYSPSEKALSKSPTGLAQVQEFHRQLFAICSNSLREEIKHISVRQMRDSATEVEPTSGNILTVNPEDHLPKTHASGDQIWLDRIGCSGRYLAVSQAMMIVAGKWAFLPRFGSRLIDFTLLPSQAT